MEINKVRIQKTFENPIGKEFYTFYLQESNRGTRFNIDTGVYKVRIIEENPNSVYMAYKFQVVEILGKPSPSVKDKLEYFVNAYHAQSTYDLFTTQEEAIESHDREIKKMISNPRCNADELNILYKKLIVPLKEIDLAKIWYKSLDKSHKNFIKILQNE